MNANTTGCCNTAVGQSALASNTTGNGNVAIGGSALQNSVSTQNTAVGTGALSSSTGGINNIAIGWGAGGNIADGDSNDIDIGSPGVSTDGASANSGVIRIGTVGAQTGAFIAGIYGASPSVTNLPVCVDANGTLGTSGCSAPSSRRFKDRITDMGDSSSKLLQLRPVTFFYKPQYDDGSHSLQYGLIAEEVANVYPEMVGYDQNGQPASVKYQSLAPMLLNEVQKLNAQLQKQVQLQQDENRKLEDRLAALEALLASQAPAPKAAGTQ
jgi:hypothetical protein